MGIRLGLVKTRVTGTKLTCLLKKLWGTSLDGLVKLGSGLGFQKFGFEPIGRMGKL